MLQRLFVSCLLLAAVSWMPLADAQEVVISPAKAQKIQEIRQSIPDRRAHEAAVLRNLLQNQQQVHGSVPAAAAQRIASPMMMNSKYRRVPYRQYPSRFYESTRSPYAWYRPNAPATWEVFQLPRPPRLSNTYRGIKHPSQWPGR
jgi:hypothetical protein